MLVAVVLSFRQLTAWLVVVHLFLAPRYARAHAAERQRVAQLRGGLLSCLAQRERDESTSLVRNDLDACDSTILVERLSVKDA